MITDEQIVWTEYLKRVRERTSVAMKYKSWGNAADILMSDIHTLIDRVEELTEICQYARGCMDGSIRDYKNILPIKLRLFMGTQPKTTRQNGTAPPAPYLRKPKDKINK